MCLAIVKPGNLVIPTDYLERGWQYNPDGAGFAFVKDGKVEIKKGYMSLKDFLGAYNKYWEENKKSTFLIHFRIRTFGAKGPYNTHPFEIKDGALIHNGSVSGVGAQSDGPSDTALFARKYSNVLSYDTVHKHRAEFEDAVGYNKIAMLYHDGRYLILNEKAGDWDNDIWYSNSSYKRTSTRTRSTGSVYDGRGIPHYGRNRFDDDAEAGIYTGD